MRTSSRGCDSRRQAILLLRGSRERLPLPPSDAALAQRIHREAVVWKGYLDHVIGRYSKTPLNRLDPDVLATLRAGAAQLLVMRVPSHAAVSATVDAHGRRKTMGLVNAVLRKVAAHSDEPELPLHIRYSHPKVLVEGWLSIFGEERTRRLLEWNNTAPELGGYAFGGRPEGFQRGRFLEEYGTIPRKGVFSPPEGFYLQDESAAIVGRGMADLPGSPVLEIGAAPGGKTAHLQRKGPVFSMDPSLRRMKRWGENCRRLHWEDSLPLIAEVEALPFSTLFQKVVVDAPCSNTGVYRRRYDARWNWTPELSSTMAGIQGSILQNASLAVAPGGCLVYSTCSLEPEENMEVVQRFESSHGEFTRIPFPGPSELVDGNGTLSYFPPDAGIDGLFAAAWRKTGQIS